MRGDESKMTPDEWRAVVIQKKAADPKADGSLSWRGATALIPYNPTHRNTAS